MKTKKTTQKLNKSNHGLKIVIGLALALVVFVVTASTFSTHAVESTASAQPNPSDSTVTPYGSIGKWMLQSNGQIANYGGKKFNGKLLLEPINIVIVDPNSKSTFESMLKVNWDMMLARFPSRIGHSTGFKGVIGGSTYSQQPGGLVSAYSDNSFWAPNNHGRLFGPAQAPGGGYIYSGAFSAEKLTVSNWVPAHVYVSYSAARDALARGLVASGQAQSVSIDLANTYNTDTTTTDDHDGKAVVIVLK